MATWLELAFRFGPVHLIGKASANDQERTGWPFGPIRETVTAIRWASRCVL